MIFQFELASLHGLFGKQIIFVSVFSWFRDATFELNFIVKRKLIHFEGKVINSLEFIAS